MVHRRQCLVPWTIWFIGDNRVHRVEREERGRRRVGRGEVVKGTRMKRRGRDSEDVGGGSR